MAGIPLPAGEVERRRRYVAPLFGYLRSRCMRQAGVLREVYAARGIRIGRARVANLKRGCATVPEWLVGDVCALLGRPMAAVMGAEWSRRATSSAPAARVAATAATPVGASGGRPSPGENGRAQGGRRVAVAP